VTPTGPGRRPVDDATIEITSLPPEDVESTVPSLETAAAAALGESLRALAQDLDAQIAAGGDPARLARLLYERGRLDEERFGAPERALGRYQQALRENRDHLPAIRAARRILLETGNARTALDLFDAEIRLAPDPARKAEVLVAKARVEEHRLGDRAAALLSIQKALDLDRHSRAAQKAGERLLHREESWQALEELYHRMVDTIGEDPVLRAAFEVQRARLHEFRLGGGAAALLRHQAAIERDPACVPALEGLKRLLLAGGRWKDLSGVLEQEASTATDARLQALDHYRVGRAHADRLGQSDRALVALERAAAADPQSLVVLAELGRLLEQAAQWPQRAAVLHREIEATSDPVERLDRIHHLAAVLEEKLDQPAEAMTLHRQALAIDPTFGPALRALGRMYRARGLWPELVDMTLAELERTVDPVRRAAGHHEVGVVLEQQMGRPEEAALQFERALAFDPAYTPAFKALTRLYADLSRFRELAERYEQAADGAKQKAWAIGYLEKAGAIWEERVGELDRAAAAYSRVLDLDDQSLTALHALQRVHERAGRWPDLIRALEREAEHAEHGGEVAAILHRVAEIHEHSVGDADAAIAAFRRVLQVDPRHRPTLSALGRLLTARGRWDDVLDLYARELDVSAGGADKLPVLFKMGEILEQKLGRVNDAVARYREALDADPAWRPALRALSRIHRDRGDWEALAEILDAEARSLTDPSGRAAAFFRVAEIHEDRLGSLDLAAEAYEACLSAAPGDVVAIEALLRLQSARGAWDAAQGAYARLEAATADPGTKLRAILGAAEVFAGPLAEPSKAAASFERALEIDPGCAVALVALEGLHRKLGRTDDLARTLERLAARPGDVASRVAALHQLAHVQETRTHPHVDPAPTYRAVLELSPGDPAALDALERIALVARDGAALADVLVRRLATVRDPALQASCRLRLAEALEVAGDVDGAAREYAAALEVESDLLTAIRGLERTSSARGDRAGMEQAARREASALRDAPSAARALIRAAHGALERRDVDGALRDVERALELDADSEDAAAMLESLLSPRAEEARLADVLSRAATAATTPVRRAALHHRVGELQRDVLRDRTAAAAAFGRALRADVNHVPSLVALAELNLALDQWTEAVVVLQRLMSVAKDADVVRRATLQLADVWDDKLGEPRRAIESLERVLRTSPKNAEALSRLAKGYGHVGEFGLAVETLLRLVDAEETPAAQVEALSRLVDVRIDAGDSKGAADTLRRAMAIESKARLPDRALARLAELLGARGDWEGLAAATRAQIDAVGPADPRSAALHVSLGEILSGRLGRAEDAIGHFRAAVGAAPDRGDWRLQLGALLRKANRLEEAAAEHEAIVAADPLQIAAWRELRRLDERIGRKDRMHLCEAALSYLRAADPVEAHSYRSWRAARPPASWGKVPGELYTSLLHPWARMPAIDLLQATSIHLARLFPPDLEGYGLMPRDRIGPKDGHPLWAGVRSIAEALGVDAELQVFIHRMPGKGVGVEATSPVSIVVPTDLLERSDREQTWVLTRALCSVLFGTFVLARLTPREVDAHLVAMVRPWVPGFGSGVTAEDYLDERAKQIQKALPRAVRKGLEPTAKKHAQSLAVWSPARFVEGAAMTLDRAALLLCDDLATGLDLLKRSDPALVGHPMTTPEETAACLAKSKPALELLRFLASPEHSSLRRAIGIAEV